MQSETEQREAIAFLRDPASYGPGIERVEVVETHISLVFLAGAHAYKLKRAVKFPYLDFSTLARRRAACEAELVVNRRTAPALYLECRGLARGADGRIRFSNEGDILDWVVVMRRFDQALLFDALARTGRLDRRLVDALGDHIAAFHAAAEPRPDYGGATAMRAIAEESIGCLRAARRVGFAADDIGRLERRWQGELSRLGPVLDRRRAAGKVRHGHGDLHLRNICLFDGQPMLFDGIEFSERIASIDVLYDLAFVLMDLDHRGLGDLANRLMNRYLDATGEDDGLPALPLFLSLRAAIRAHVTAAALEGGKHAGAGAAHARAYLALAQSLLAPKPARLIAIGGLSGSGKSTLAAALAPGLGRRPGARVLRSDVIRKRMFGRAPETRLPPEAYTPAVSQRVYAALHDKATLALAAGYAAIIDAVALKPAERDAVAKLAARAGVPFAGLWLDAPATQMKARLDARRGDASDASAQILAAQMKEDPGPIAWTRLPADGDPDAVFAVARDALDRSG